MAVNYLRLSRRKWREKGYVVWTTETITRYGGRDLRHDLFGFVDMVAVKVGKIVLLQVTSWGNVSARANKIARESAGRGQYERPMIEIAKTLLSVFGVRIVVEGWQKKSNRWQDRELEITPEELDKRRDA